MGWATAESLGHVDSEFDERASATGPLQHCPQHNEWKDGEDNDPHDRAENTVPLVEPEVLGGFGQVDPSCLKYPGPILSGVKIYQRENSNNRQRPAPSFPTQNDE